MFTAEFDRAGLVLSIASILILLYYGLAMPQFTYDFWVAFAFWAIGFFGSLYMGLTKRSASITLQSIFTTTVMIGVIIIVFAGINTAYGIATQADVLIADKLLSFAIGVSEELFFGVFLLAILINWIGIPPLLAILLSAGSHAWYHVPNWGSNPLLLMVFVLSFTVARFIYVFVAPKVSVLLGAHGIWNFAVGG